MTTFFHPHDLRYAWLALAFVCLDRIVLYRLLRPWPMAWHWLHLPATVLHELTHFVVAGVLGGSPRIVSLRPQRMPAGGVQLGCVAYVLTDTGKQLAQLAPLVWYPAAFVLAAIFMEQPQSLLAGLGWLALVLPMIYAAQLVSADDLRGIGWPTGVLLTAIAINLLLQAAVRVPVLLCGSFGVLCHGWLPQ